MKVYSIQSNDHSIFSLAQGEATSLVSVALLDLISDILKVRVYDN